MQLPRYIIHQVTINISEFMCLKDWYAVKEACFSSDSLKKDLFRGHLICAASCHSVKFVLVQRLTVSVTILYFLLFVN